MYIAIKQVYKGGLMNDILEKSKEFEATFTVSFVVYRKDDYVIFKTKDLKVEEGKDYCTLVTCTPYGVNTHRLLVRGHRVETTEAIHVSADAVQMDQRYAAFVIGAVILLVLLIIMFVQQAARRKKRSQQHQ